MTHRLVIFGSGTFGIPVFTALAHDQRYRIVAVVSQPPRPTARGPTETPVAAWARNLPLPWLTFPTLKDPAAVRQLQTLQADTFVVIAYGLILPPAVLDLPRQGCVNVHASLLPKYRGAAPIAAALVAGDAITGVTILQMDAGIDTGPILAQAESRIEPAQTAPELAERLAAQAAKLLPNVLADWLAGALTPQPQTAIGASYVSKLTKQDGRASWEFGRALERKIRAYQPWPGVWTEWQGKRLKFLAATFEPGSPAVPAGCVATHPAAGWAIACTDGWLIPTRVQLAGKTPQPADRFPGNYPGLIGSQLE